MPRSRRSTFPARRRSNSPRRQSPSAPPAKMPTAPSPGPYRKPGLGTQAAGMVGQGLAFGAGSAVAHNAINRVFDGSSGSTQTANDRTEANSSESTCQRLQQLYLQDCGESATDVSSRQNDLCANLYHQVVQLCGQSDLATTS